MSSVQLQGNSERKPESPHSGHARRKKLQMYSVQLYRKHTKKPFLAQQIKPSLTLAYIYPLPINKHLIMDWVVNASVLNRKGPQHKGYNPFVLFPLL